MIPLSSLSGQKTTPTADQQAENFPMKSVDAISQFNLTDFEMQEVHQFDDTIYYCG